MSDSTINGGGVAAGPSTTQFYLSTDAVCCGGDTLLVLDRSVPGLAAGATSSGTTSVTIPPGTVPGSYYIIAKADGPGSITESNELNNTRSKAITIQ